MYKTAIALSLIALISCRKEVQKTPVQPDPLFSVDYIVNGSYNTLNAGKDDYYMHSSSDKDEFNIGQLIGELKNSNAIKTNAFEFKFRSNSKTDLDLNSVLTLGKKDLTDTNLLQASNTKVRLDLDAQTTDNVIKYVWSVNTNLSSALKSPSFVFDSNEDNDFPVSLQTYFDTGCVATTKRCINFSNMSCYGDFAFTKDASLGYTFSVPPYMAGDVSHVVWYVNNQVMGTSKEFNYTFQGAGNYLISADVFFNSGCMSCLSKRVLVDYGSTYNGCLSDFNVTYTTFNNASFLQLNTIEINYWDDSGTLYSSVFSANPGDIEILEISDYDNNEVGNSTKKIRFSGVVTLTDIIGSKKTVDIQEAIIAVETGQ